MCKVREGKSDLKDFKKGEGGERRMGRGEGEIDIGSVEWETVGFADVKIGRDMMHANYR